MKNLLLVIMLIALLAGCSEESSTEPEVNLEDYLYNGVAIAQTDNAQYDYIVNDIEGNMVMYDWDYDQVDNVVCRDTDGNWVQMQFENGMPKYFYSEDYVVVIENNYDGTADFGVVEISTGEVNISRNVAFDIGIDGRDWYGDVAEGLRFASRSLYVFSAITTYIGVAPGPQSPIALTLGTVGFMLGVISEVSSSYFDELEESSQAFELGAGAIDCSVGDCVGLALTISADALQIMSENQDTIQSTQGILIGGYGDIQITLTWDNDSDLDLYVTDPNDETICYYNTTSESGGWLDFDDTDGYGPENVFWENGTAPEGEYFVELNHFYGVTASDYIITISIGSNITTYSGTIGLDETIEICSFTYSDSKNISIKELGNHKPTSNNKPPKQ